MNNRGQTIIVGLMILVMAVIVFMATIPAIRSVMNSARASNSLNCKGYIDSEDTTLSYNASRSQEDTLSCTILDLGIPYLILGVLVALVAKLLHGQLTEEPQPQYPQYAPGGY
jgi:hypothetical protein